MDNLWVGHSVMKLVDTESSQTIKSTPEGGDRKNDDFDMDIIEYCALEKALNVKNKTLERKHGYIYEEIEDYYFNESKVKFPKEFLMKYKMEYNVPQFIPYAVKKNIQQVGLKYGLSSKC